MSNLKQIGYFAVAVLSVKGLGFLLLPISTRFLSQVEFGQLNFLVTVSALCSLILSIGLPELLLKQQYNTHTEKLALFRDAVITTFIFSLLFAGCSLIFSEQIAHQLPAKVDPLDLRLLIVNLVLSALIGIPYIYYRLTNNARTYCYLCISHALVQTTLTITLLFLGFSITGVMVSGVVSSLLIVCISYFDILKVINVSYSEFSWRIQGKQTVFIISIVISSLFIYAGNGAENWFIVANFDETLLANYYVAAQFAVLTSFTFEPIRLWWFAKRFSLVKNNKSEYESKAILCLNVGLALCVVMSVLAPITLNLVLPDNYHGNEHWLVLLIVVVAIRHHSDILNIGCYTHKNGIWVPIINFLTALVGLSLLYLLVPMFGVEGAILSLIIMQSFKLLCFYLTSQKFVPLTFKLSSLAPSWLALLIIAGISFMPGNLILQLGVLLAYIFVFINQYKSIILRVIKKTVEERKYAQLL